MTAPRPTPMGRLLVGAAIVLLALNLRVAVGSLGVVLTQIRDDLNMSVTVSGILTTLPVICFALAGLGAHQVVRRIGLHTTTVLLLAMVALGIAGRSLLHDGTVFLLASVVALAGSAVGNIILPPLAKRHFPDRIALISAMYGGALMAGGAVSALTTVPLSSALGGWRQGTAAWAMLAVVAVVPWLRFLQHDVHVDPVGTSRLGVRELARSPVAWSLALVFGAQSAQAYAQFGWLPAILVDAGVSEPRAGVMLSLVSGVGIPLALTLPILLRVVGDLPILPIGFALLTAAGWIGVLRSPTDHTWVWASLLGLGGGAFTWTLTMIGKRARTADGTIALSGFAQGIGYALACIGPFGAGVLHAVSGGWQVPVAALAGSAALIGVFGTVVVRGGILEDALRSRG